MRVDSQKLHILTTITNDDRTASEIHDVFVLSGDRILVSSKVRVAWLCDMLGVTDFQDRGQVFALSADTAKAVVVASMPAACDIDVSTEDSSVLLLCKDSIQVLDFASPSTERSMRVRLRFEPIDPSPPRTAIVVPFGISFVFSADGVFPIIIAGLSWR